MHRHKLSVVLLLLLTMSFTLFAPATVVHAAALSDLLGGDSGGSGLFNILLGLLFGKLLGGSGSDTDIGKVLGLSTTPAAPSANPNAIIATGQKYMGVPYVWGGETPAGFDCSGFTQYVMKQNGVTIPRTAAEQFAAGSPVAKDKLQAGDLVFFTTYKPGASHVGFYMGDGKFLHASSGAKKVTVSKLDEAYYTERYIGARRY
ncbi:C40 family peptidase [Anaeroselena agilis]|uniref:C40 family peptidase n=1 Tax=Anaeroselena agilis TaxID=3063788 RepID=A0ABU3P212_9FIRM|nr:C40 family peptidase [Selenomonadales bacterium 4137-cl]